jgi:hypothetical protein
MLICPNRLLDFLTSVATAKHLTNKTFVDRFRHQHRHIPSKSPNALTLTPCGLSFYDDVVSGGHRCASVSNLPMMFGASESQTQLSALKARAGNDGKGMSFSAASPWT